MLTPAARLARIEPPDQPLPVFRRLRTIVDNPIKAWPRVLYRDRIYRSRLLGRDIIYVMAPDLIRTVLLDDADSFEKGEVARRALGPALGDAILIGWIAVAMATPRRRRAFSSGADPRLFA